jgi:hypothetical protein
MKSVKHIMNINFKKMIYYAIALAVISYVGYILLMKMFKMIIKKETGL